MIKITIITGFLGAGKTTLINKIIKENPVTKFGLIINEFGEVGVDSEIVSSTEQEITEISNGCLCCVVRSDLIGAVSKMIDTGKIDHLIIETSGLAEPKPIAQTFLMDDLGGRVMLDGIYCLIDAENFDSNISHYSILKEQIQTSDVAILNKLDMTKTDFNNNLTKFVTTFNPQIAILENTDTFSTKLLLDFQGNFEDKVIEMEHIDSGHHHGHNDHVGHDHSNHDHSHGDHHQHHEHEDFDEVLFTSSVELDPGKLDQYIINNFPKNVIRAKGFLRMKNDLYLFQMVGANKGLDKYVLSENSKIDPTKSYLVFIGKGLNKEEIIQQMHNCEIIK
jgi:G3E family GTPase